MVIKKKKVEIKLKDFGADKKGRKGEYYYVKEFKKKGKYYKKKEGLKERDYLEYYKRGIVSKRGGVSKKRLNVEKRLDELTKKYPKIEDELGKGYAEHTIRNVTILTPQGINKAYKDLLANKGKEPLVRDKDLIDILTRPENLEKWKHRVMYEVRLNGENEIIATIINNVIKTLPKVRREILEEARIGSEIGAIYKDLKSLEKKGYNVSYNKRGGRVKSISIKMTFRKG